MSFRPPDISPDELLAFHQAHFSSSGVQRFSADFFTSAEQSNTADDDAFEEDEDDLGYYADGVKRTLTNEQIAMFRHSEIQALRRQRQERLSPRSDAEDVRMESGEVEFDAVRQDGSGHLASDTGLVQPPAQSASAKKKRKTKNKSAKAKAQEPKPDLRKRTWDVVETGLDSLEYD